MKKYRKILCVALIMTAALCLFSVPAFAISESDVQAQVDSVGKEAVAGNVFIWFLCAIAFLKVSQKIDSFMSSLGINVGHTGGSMVGEAIIAAKAISVFKGVSGGGFRGGGGRSSSGHGPGSAAATAAASFMCSGLAGAVGRQFTSGAVKTATGASGGGIGGKMFASSMEKGGNFANNVIGTVAQGSMSSVGSMTGERASQALRSYMGYAGVEGGEDVPAFSNVEIGGGRIMGTETTSEHPNGISFGMYHTDQYTAPESSYSTVTAADGSQWYKQYAVDAVEKTPYMAPDGAIAYNESIVKKLPNPPRRKDRI